jgi:hypothetical protein
MQHTAKGASKIVKECTLPLTSARRVDLVVTELAVIAFPGGRATLLETGPGVSVTQVAAVAAPDRARPGALPAAGLDAQRGQALRHVVVQLVCEPRALLLLRFDQTTAQLVRGGFRRAPPPVLAKINPA